jgi:hypothetical protein
MADNLQIPLLVGKDNFTFTTTLDSAVYRFSVKWNATAEAWFLNLSGLTNEVVVNGIRLVSGVNLLKPFAIRQLGAIYMIDRQNKNTDPNLVDLGTRYCLKYVPIENTSEII